jgi:hypothetical protein
MLKLENRNSKLAAHNVTLSEAGVYEVVDSRSRGKGPMDDFRTLILAA